MEPGPAPSLFGAVRRLLGSLLAAGETRLRLAVLELEEERARLTILLIMVGLGMVMLMLGLGMLMLLVVVVFWDTHRLLAIGLCAAALLGGGALLSTLALRQARRHTLLKETLAQLALDRELAQSSREDARQS